jgi:hypothetical protein
MKNILIIVTILCITACDDFLDVNQNPNDPTKAPLSSLLTSSEKNVADGLSIGSGNNGGIGTDLATYVHQQTSRSNSDQYNVDGNGFWVNAIWVEYFQEALADIDVIIVQANETKALTYSGIGKILKAYAFSQLVDVFGDVPFTEFNNFKVTSSPKFDDDAEIYPKLLKMLDDGIADIDNDKSVAALKPGNDDLIYAGNTIRWRKAANTIKLKLLNQIRLVKDVKSDVTLLLSKPDALINSEAESFLFPYGNLGATDDRHPGFGDYTATQRSNHISPWFYEILKGYNKFVYTGIPDPRLPYYIYNQMTPASATPNPPEYRDGAFLSIYFGSVGKDRDHSQQNAISLFGIYPVGGRYDDGNGGTANAGSGTGAAPYRFITYADRLYIEAELVQQGLVTGDVNDLFKRAVNASISQVDYVVGSFVKPTQIVPKLSGSTAATTYVTKVNELFQNASSGKKLEFIMTQKWLSNVGSTVDQFTDYRRTGHPLFFDPKNSEMAPGGVVKSNAPNSNIAIAVQLNNPYPASIPWPTNELERNRNAPAQKNASTYKVFWQK